MTAPNEPPGDRLERALAAFLEAPPTTPADADRLLAAHLDLRDLLEPMLEPAQDRPSDDTEVLGDYRLRRELGRGGMGVVHEAWQRSLDRRVAVKVLTPGLCTSPQAIARFRREASAAGRLDHPHIVEVYGFGNDGGRHFFAMQFVDGQPLHEVAARFRQPERAVALVRQVAEALAHAHSRGLVHRDVKPGNVLVTAQDHAFLTDFGIARDESLPSLTQDGSFLGTPDYASPEQVRGKGVDARTDVWSLGVILFELLAGEPPFRADTREALLHRILTEEPAPLRGRAGISDDLAAIVLRALEKAPDRRYATARAFADDLAALVEHRPVSARLPTTFERLQRWVRREPWQATTIAGLGLGLLTTGAGFWLASERAATEAQARQQLADKVEEYDLLSGVVLLDRARASERTLFPAWPNRIEAMERWLALDCGRLERLRPAIAHALATLRRAALPAQGEGPVRLPTEPQQFRFDTLTELDRGIADLLQGPKQHVLARLDWARRVHALTFAHPKARVTWAAARAAIATADGEVAHTAYAGTRPRLDDDDVLGLVPIGMNPVTKLWEFYDLRSAWDGTGDPAALPIPTHDTDGRIAVEPGTGIVFALLPGGTFAMGAQAKDPDGRHHDPEAPDFVGPVQDVTLAPFLMARHETTQAQWERLATGADALRRPSGFAAGFEFATGRFITAVHPVERVTWTAAVHVLGEHALSLPTEAQWEYACRAGTGTPWWTGKDSDSLAGAANVYDRAATREALKPEVHEDFDDGHVLHAPVGSFRANPFGLFDMHGNVGEWCLDAPALNRIGFGDGDGARRSSDFPNDRSQRGGSYQQQGRPGRSSLWVIAPLETRAIDLGVRAVRRLGPH